MSSLIAITGATGFAGGHAVTELLARGHRLRALVRDPAKAKLPDAVEIVKGDLGDVAALARLTAGAEVVVHLAGALSALRREGYFSVNEEGTRALADAAEAAGVRRFVHVSSLAARQPQLSPYAASKRAGEEVVKARMAGLNAIIIRPPAVYGPGDRGTLPLIRELTRPVALLPSPPQARFSLIHAHDLARLIADAAENDVQGLHEVSDGKEGGHDWPELTEVAAAFRGAPVHPIFLPRWGAAAVAFAVEMHGRIKGRHGLVNRGKIAELYQPDWVAREGSLALATPTAFRDGFAETVAWYRKAGWLPQGLAPDTTAPNSRTSR